MTTDLDKLDVKQLDALIAKATTVKSQLREKRRLELRADFERRSASEGFTLADIVAATTRTKQRTAKYVHPTDPTMTWTGLGRVPSWLKALSADGDFERFRTDTAGAQRGAR